MSDEDKKDRWKELYDVVAKNTAQYWAKSFISELEKAHEDTRHSVLIQHMQPKQWLKDFQQAEQRVLFLDYDGTIQAYESAPATFVSPRRLIDLLTKLTSNPHNLVYVMSGRMRDSIDKRLGSVPNLGLCAENGSFVKAPGATEWENLFPTVDLRWMDDVKKIFEYYEERTPGALIETKEVSLVWHYRMADNPGYGAWQAAELQNHIEDAIGVVYPIHCIAGNKNVEVLPSNVNKSAAAKHIFESLCPGFVLAIGDDRADEDLFSLVNNLEAAQFKVTCTVGSKSSEAQYFVTGVAAVLGTLEILSEW
jgi:trehalose 6-phosphate synthase/phosphatase